MIFAIATTRLLVDIEAYATRCYLHDGGEMVVIVNFCFFHLLGLFSVTTTGPQWINQEHGGWMGNQNSKCALMQ